MNIEALASSSEQDLMLNDTEVESNSGESVDAHGDGGLIELRKKISFAERFLRGADIW